MDRTADIFLRRAFLELAAFTIPEVGTFVRPDSRKQTAMIPLRTFEEESDQSTSLIDFLIQDCDQSASEAQAMETKIKVALRSSIKLRQQYYVPGAGTILKKTPESDILQFKPEPTCVDSWFPAKKIAHLSDSAPAPVASRINIYALIGAVASMVLIVGFIFFLKDDDANETAVKPTVIAKAPNPKEDTIKTESAIAELNNSASNEVNFETMQESNSDDNEEASEGASFTDNIKLDRKDFISDGFKIPNITPYPDNQRGSDNDSAYNGPVYHIIAASSLNKDAASRFCSYIRYPESCELLELPGNPGKYRVSIFRAKGQKSARVRRTYYRENGCPDCWVFPPLPKQ